MKNSWLIWLFIVGVVITVLVAFNYQGNKNSLPLSEIFPEEKTVPTDIEYEFVDETIKPVAVQQAALEPATPVQQQVDTPKTTEVTPLVKAQPIAKASSATQEAVKELNTKQIPFTIQVASFKTKDAAQASLNKVIEKGYQGFILSKNLGEKGTWHRVYIGTFQTKPEAEQVLTKVKQDYPSSFVIAPK